MTDTTKGMPFEEELRPLVAKGLEYIKETHPGWDDFVSLPDLDLENPAHCVLGQLEGSYLRYLNVHDKTDAWALAHGFLIEGNGSGYFNYIEPKYRALTDLWHAELEQLRDQKD